MKLSYGETILDRHSQNIIPIEFTQNSSFTSTTFTSILFKSFVTLFFFLLTNFVTGIIRSYFILVNLGTIKVIYLDFPGGAVVKNPPANAGDMGSSPGLGRSHMPQSS